MLSVYMLSAGMDPATMKTALLVLFAILGILALSTLIYTFATLITKKGSKLILAGLWIATVLALVCSLLCLGRFNQLNQPPATAPSSPVVDTTTAPTTEATVPTTE